MDKCFHLELQASTSYRKPPKGSPPKAWSKDVGLSMVGRWCLADVPPPKTIPRSPTTATLYNLT